MGNCCSGQHPSSSSWGGDDWGSVTSKRRRKTILFQEAGEGSNALTSSSCNAERQNLLGLSSSGSSSSSSISLDDAIISNNPLHGEIKIKISKKVLEKLMETVDTREQAGLNVNQVLSRLMKTNMNGYHEMRHHQHSWRPVLQSIPEVN